MKNWEFGQEAFQNSDPIRGSVFIDTARGSNQNFERQPTPPKTNSSSCLSIEVYLNPPVAFSWGMHVAACYIEIDNRCLLLQQAPHKVDPGRWGVPAGKLETNETPLQGAKRELFEETGILLPAPNQCQYLTTLYMRKPHLDYVYHLFQINLDEVPLIRLSTEHQNHQWIPQEALKTLPLMIGAEEGLYHFYENKKSFYSPL